MVIGIEGQQPMGASLHIPGGVEERTAHPKLTAIGAAAPARQERIDDPGAARFAPPPATQRGDEGGALRIAAGIVERQQARPVALLLAIGALRVEQAVEGGGD